jgi:hypothetical protein
MPKTVPVVVIGLLITVGCDSAVKSNRAEPVANSVATVSASNPVMRPYCFLCTTPDDEKSCANPDPAKRYSVEIPPIGENRYACCPEGFVPTIVDPDGGMLTANCKPAP